MGKNQTILYARVTKGPRGSEDRDEGGGGGGGETRMVVALTRGS